MNESTGDMTPSLFVTFAGLLLALGTLLVYSSSITARPSEVETIYLSKQLSFAFVAIFVGITAASVPSTWWKRVAPILFLATIGMLIAVLIPGIGRTVNGAQRWFRIGPVSFQPSETAKLTLPLMVCALRYRDKAEKPSFTEFLVQGAVIGGTLFLIVIEPDLGTSLFVGMAAVLALFLSGWPLRHFFIAGGLVIPLGMTMVALKPYQMARIQGFIETWRNPDAAPYQVQQSLTTLGVGGTSGTGLGRGWQKLSFLPEANTDFIFSVLGEELGLIGTLAVVLLWVGLYITGRRLIARVKRDSFESVLAATLLTQIVLQAIINVGVVTAMLPPKGISHPLLSYGGSNLVITIASLGMILSLTRTPDTIAIEQTVDPELESRSPSVDDLDEEAEVEDSTVAA